MSNAARDGPVFISAGEFFCVGTWLGVRRTVCVAFERNGRHRDDRSLGKPLFQVVIFRLAFGQAEPPTVVVDHHVDVVGIVE